MTAAPKDVIRLDDPVVNEKGGLTFKGLVALAERLRFMTDMEDSIDVEAVPVQERRTLGSGDTLP